MYSFYRALRCLTPDAKDHPYCEVQLLKEKENGSTDAVYSQEFVLHLSTPDSDTAVILMDRDQEIYFNEDISSEDIDRALYAPTGGDYTYAENVAQGKAEYPDGRVVTYDVVFSK